LRLVTDISDDKKLGDWIRDAEQYGQVNWPIGGATPDAERQQFDQVVRRAEELTRSQVARRLLTADGVIRKVLAAVEKPPNSTTRAKTSISPERFTSNRDIVSSIHK